MDLTSPQIWDRYHLGGERHKLPVILKPESLGHRRLIALLGEVLPRGPGRRFLEVGCGGSQYLPFIGREFGLRLHGVDYSPAGAEIARRNLALLGLHGEIVQGDFLDPETLRGQRFDAIGSFGVIEHSDEPQRFVQRVAELLAPGGVAITQVPNLLGYSGALLRLCDPEVYHQHYPIDPERLHEIHVQAGLVPVRPAGYFGTFNLWQLNPWTTLFNRFPWPLPRLLPKAITAVNRTAALAIQWSGARGESRLLSPDVIAVYRKPAT